MLLPEQIIILARKLVQGSVADFVDFYHGGYDSPPKIKREVAVAICTDPGLRLALATKLGQSSYWDLTGWFNVFPSFCSDTPEFHLLITAVERAFLDFSGTPEFSKDLESGYRMDSKLLNCSARQGCLAAVRVLKAIEA